MDIQKKKSKNPIITSPEQKSGETVKLKRKREIFFLKSWKKQKIFRGKNYDFNKILLFDSREKKETSSFQKSSDQMKKRQNQQKTSDFPKSKSPLSLAKSCLWLKF